MGDRSSSPGDDLAARLGEQKLSPEDSSGGVRPPASSGLQAAPMARRDQHLVKPRGSEEERAAEVKRRQEEEKRELEQEEKTAAKQKAMIGQTRSRRSSKESIDADESGLSPVPVYRKMSFAAAATRATCLPRSCSSSTPNSRKAKEMRTHDLPRRQVPG